MEEDYIKCFSCGALSLKIEGDCHEYMLASSGCYEMFKEVLEKEYSDFTYAKAHHYTVDAYAIQHPGEITNRKAINSVGTHLMSLYFLFNKELNLDKAAQVKMEFAQFNKSKTLIKPLESPEEFKGLTVFDVWNNDNPHEHFELCKNWAYDAWMSWGKHHETIDNWAQIFVRETKFMIDH